MLVCDAAGYTLHLHKSILCDVRCYLQFSCYLSYVMFLYFAFSVNKNYQLVFSFGENKMKVLVLFNTFCLF